MASTSPEWVLRRNNVAVSGNPSGRVIVFAHGYGCSQASWNRVAPRFEEDHRVVLFGHVGAGESDLSAYDRRRYDSLHGYADDNRADLTQVAVPTLVLQSTDDLIAPLEVGEYVHRAIPQSGFRVRRTTGHLPNLSGPDELADAVRAHLS